MSVEQTNVIDIIAFDERSGYVVLTITDHLKWEADASEHLFLLQDKINSYLRFVEGGEVAGAHPRGKDKPVRIDLVLKFEPNTQAIDFLEKAKLIVETANIAFSYGPLKLDLVQRPDHEGGR